MPLDDKIITTMNHDIGIIKERTEQIHNWINGNGREGARDRLTRVEAILEKVVNLSESNARSISMMQGMIGDVETISSGCVKEALTKHEEGEHHNFKFQIVWLVVKDPKFILGVVAVVAIVIFLALQGSIELPFITP